MYDHGVFAVLTPKDPKNRARTAFGLAHNSKWFQGAIGGVAEEPIIDSRETTPAYHDDGESANARLVLSFDKLLKSDLTDGIRFGSDPTQCHVLLGHRGTEGISALQYNITVDKGLRIWLHDRRSTHGTAVEYGGQCQDQIRRRETWILSYAPGYGNPFGEIQIHAGRLIFQIEFPNHIKLDEPYMEKLQKFVEKGQGLPTMGRLDIQSAPTTATPSQAQTPGTRAIYFKDKTIGEGQFGEVSRVIRARDGVLFASKTILAPTEKRKRDQPASSSSHKIQCMRKEFALMKLTKHPNIVNVIEFREGLVPQLILEYYPLGNWTDAKIQLEDECVTAFGQVLDGLRHLHQTGIAHRDLKPDNILVERNPYLRFAISDFGLSKLITDTALLTTFCGTLKYAAPEVFPGTAKSYEVSVDIWSLGILVLEAIYGIPKPPEISKSSHPWKEWTHSWFERLRHKLHDQEDNDILAAILTDMISFNPDDRPDANVCLRRGFEAGIFERRADDELVISRDLSNLEQTTRWTTSSRSAASPGASTSPQSEASTVVNDDLHYQEHLQGNENSSQPDGHHRILLPEDHTTESASQGYQSPLVQEGFHEEGRQQLTYPTVSTSMVNGDLWSQQNLLDIAGQPIHYQRTLSTVDCTTRLTSQARTLLWQEVHDSELQRPSHSVDDTAQSAPGAQEHLAGHGGGGGVPAAVSATGRRQTTIQFRGNRIKIVEDPSWPGWILTEGEGAAVAYIPSHGNINMTHMFRLNGEFKEARDILKTAVHRHIRKIPITSGPRCFRGTYVTLKDAQTLCSQYSIQTEIISWLTGEETTNGELPTASSGTRPVPDEVLLSSPVNEKTNCQSIALDASHLSTRELYSQSGFVHMVVQRKRITMRTSDFQLNASEITRTLKNREERRRLLDQLRKRGVAGQIEPGDCWVPFQDGVFLCQKVGLEDQVKPLLSLARIALPEREENYLLFPRMVVQRHDHLKRGTLDGLLDGFAGFGLLGTTIMCRPAERRINATQILRAAGICPRELQFFLDENPAITQEVRHDNKRTQGTYISYDCTAALCTRFNLDSAPFRKLIGQAEVSTERDDGHGITNDPAPRIEQNGHGAVIAKGFDNPSNRIRDSESDHRDDLSGPTSRIEQNNTGPVYVRSFNSCSKSLSQLESDDSDNSMTSHDYFTRPDFQRGSYLAPANRSYTQMLDAVRRFETTPSIRPDEELEMENENPPCEWVEFFKDPACDDLASGISSNNV